MLLQKIAGPSGQRTGSTAVNTLRLILLGKNEIFGLEEVLEN